MANRHLAKAVADAAMGEAEHPARGGPGQRLSYKCNWYGAGLHRGDRWYASSKTCSGCGHKKERLGFSDSPYHCERTVAFVDRFYGAMDRPLAGANEHTGRRRRPYRRPPD